MLIWLDAFCAKYPHIIEAFGALAPFFGTVFLAYIAYQQWQTNERKRKQELFEMRYDKIFNQFIEFSKTKENADVFFNNIKKYRFLIKNNDMKLLINSFKQYKNKHKILFEKIKPISDKYLRIEPEYTIWGIIINFISGTYEFLTPQWLQNFLSETKTVILNWFQNLTKKEQNPTEEAS